LALASTASAAIKGFNYGSTFTTGAAKTQSDFETEFTTAQNLAGTSGFTSARLYTMVQGGTTNSPIEAIPAAIKTKTSLLLGLWSSGDTFDNEIAALKSAIETYGDDFASLVDGISVGSEDLYRNSPTGIAAGSYVGADPDTIVDYINQVKEVIAGTSLSGAAIGHVDTWTAWVNGSNAGVVEACDWIGFDGYPYFEDTVANDISQGAIRFDEGVAKTQAAVGDKPIWITETGWPVSGDQVGDGVASLENAKTFWDEVGCAKLFDQVNTWWYVLQDAAPQTPSPSFGIVTDLSTTPLYDLSCDNVTVASSSSAASGKGSSTKTVSSSTKATGSAVATATGAAYSTGSGSSSNSTGSGSGSGSSGSSAGSSSNSTYTTSSPSSTTDSSSGATSSSSSTAVPVNSASGLQSASFGAL
ncbi:glycoside hydrolase superfamily, partial [Pseudomassariella vexata]